MLDAQILHKLYFKFILGGKVVTGILIVWFLLEIASDQVSES